jgi:uncharacterized phage protein gp47/JayE
MALNTRSFTDFFRLIQGKFTKNITSIDPTIKASFARALTGSTSAAAMSNQEGIKDAINQAFWQTANEDFLIQIGEYDGTIRYEAQSASGTGAAPGTTGDTVDSDTEFNYNGVTYMVTQDATVQSYSGDITLSYSGGTATAVTTLEHSLATGLSVTIAGASQDDYNGTFDITVLDENTFTYDIDDSGDLTTDSGTYTAVYALLNIESSETGADTDIGAGIEVSASSVLDGTIYIGADGIDGGLDEEDLEDYRTRVGENHSITPGIATQLAMKASAKSIAGNTRVFIVTPNGDSGGTQGEAGYLPELGETVIYVLRDNDTSILPSTSKLTETKDKILSDGNWPGNVDTDSLYVLAPTLVTQDFVFSSITPSTVTMQNSITTQLDLFFQDNATVAGTITLKQLNSFLQTVQDSTTGATLTDFSYTEPSEDMEADSGEIYSLGEVSFS